MKGPAHSHPNPHSHKTRTQAYYHEQEYEHVSTPRQRARVHKLHTQAHGTRHTKEATTPPKRRARRLSVVITHALAARGVQKKRCASCNVLRGPPVGHGAVLAGRDRGTGSGGVRHCFCKFPKNTHTTLKKTSAAPSLPQTRKKPGRPCPRPLDLSPPGHTPAGALTHAANAA
jgi:hypothetical protein